MYFCEIESTDSCFAGLSKLLGSDKYSDITFSVDGEKIPAHRAILAMRCEYFSAMFEVNELSGESEKSVLKLDVPLKEFNLILGYIYTGKLKAEDEEEVLQVLSLSQEYLMKDLTQQIEQKLKPKITLENVFKIVKFASILGLDSVLAICFEFINSNLKAVLDSVRLNELTIKAWNYILDARTKLGSNTISEIDIFKYLLKWKEHNGESIEKEQIQITFCKVRLQLMKVTDLIGVVRKSGIYNTEFLLEAFDKKYGAEGSGTCSYCAQSLWS